MKKRTLITLLLIGIQSILCGTEPPVSFTQSMTKNEGHYRKIDLTQKNFLLLKRMYDQYYAKFSSSPKKYLIPKIIHFIWLGSPLPEKTKVFIQTWRKLHPSWKIKVWTDADVKAFRMQNQKAFDKAKNWGEKSDIWRYEILYRMGGTYVDCDFECVKAFDEIHKNCEFFAGICYAEKPLLANGLIGCSPHHPIMKLCMQNIKVGKGNNDGIRIVNETGPWYFTRCFFTLAEKYVGRAVAFPITYFYSYPQDQKPEDDLIIKQKWLQPESYALHFWHNSWLKKKEVMVPPPVALIPKPYVPPFILEHEAMQELQRAALHVGKVQP